MAACLPFPPHDIDQKSVAAASWPTDRGCKRLSAGACLLLQGVVAEHCYAFTEFVSFNHCISN